MNGEKYAILAQCYVNLCFLNTWRIKNVQSSVEFKLVILKIAKKAARQFRVKNVASTNNLRTLDFPLDPVSGFHFIETKK